MPCITFINDCLKSLNDEDIESEAVLIQCKTGICLSPSIILAYLIKEKGMTLKNAWDFLINKRCYRGCSLSQNILI